MARTIASPGVEIKEFDQSNYTVAPVGTTFLLMGFADKGPTDEILELTDFEEFKEIYGQPTNAAERYFYHSANQLYSSNANVYCARLPYGRNMGDGFGNKYGALAYPVVKAYKLSENASITVDLSSSDVIFYSENISLWNPNSTEYSHLTTPITGGAEPVNALSAGGEYLPLSSIMSFPESTYSIEANKFFTSLKHLITNGRDITVNSPLDIMQDIGIIEQMSEQLDIPGLHREGSSGLNSLYNLSGVTNSLSNLSAANYIVFGAPKHIDLEKEEYSNAVESITWNNNVTTPGSSLGDYGFVILNNSQTTINDQFEGYYIGITDNEKLEPSSPYDSVVNIESVNKAVPLSGINSGSYVELPEARLDFELQSPADSNINSISETLENIPTFNVFGSQFVDSAVMGLFKLRKTVFSTDVIKLDYSLQEAYLGSFDYWRQLQSENGGPAKRMYMGNLVDNQSTNIQFLANKFITNKDTKSWLDINGNPTKAIKFNDSAKALFPVGSYSPTTATTKQIGALPNKISRILSKIEDDELFNLDGTVEAGLGTVWVYTNIGDGRLTPGVDGLADLSDTAANVFDDTIDVTKYIDNNGQGGGFYNTGLVELKGSANQVRTLYNTIANLFNTFATKTRKDHIFLLDPLRFTCVKGKTTKVLDSVTDDGEPCNFSQHVYWPMRYQFMTQNTSYGAVYANWGKVYDESSDNYIWLPCSATMASVIAYSSDVSYPWFAPAGFNRGVVNTLDEVALYPNQKQRDQLYKISLNPIAFFPNDGIVVWGQKTLQTKPSAFDRLNVRRLFLYLEKATKGALKYFVFEPNSYFTRTQVFNTLDPTFNRVKQQQGMYNYKIICNENNNTGEVIDNNEMVVDIYIAPTKAAEYIMANFYATRTNGITTTEQA